MTHNINTINNNTNENNNNNTNNNNNNSTNNENERLNNRTLSTSGPFILNYDYQNLDEDDIDEESDYPAYLEPNLRNTIYDRYTRMLDFRRAFQRRPERRPNISIMQNRTSRLSIPGYSSRFHPSLNQILLSRRSKCYY